MPFGPFALQWRAPSPNPPAPSSPLPSRLARSTISTPSGPLELLSAVPSTTTTKPPLFFAHGGFGCAEVWTQYLQFFSSKGYPCYAISYRGHGHSWYPGFWRMYFTSRDAIASDLVAGIEHVERLERERRGEKVKVVLVAHSAGGALSQFVLSRGLVKVQAFCMCAAVPGFGSWKVYSFWSLTAPIHFPYRLYHPRYILADTKQVHDAFFTPSTPLSVVKALERLLSPYESMLWPMQALFRFVTGPDVLSSITGWNVQKTNQAGGKGVITNRLLVLAAEHDVLCTPSILQDAAQRYRRAFREMVQQKKVDGVSEDNLDEKTGVDGVEFKVASGLGHHLQNHTEWDRGAKEILDWVEKLNNTTTIGSAHRPLTTTEQHARARSTANTFQTFPIFMLPEPTNVFRSVNITEPTLDNSTSSSQHGLRIDDPPASLLPNHDEERRVSPPNFDDGDASSHSPERVAGVDDADRLSPTSRSPRNRIAEYENASTQPAKKNSEGPLFEVVKKKRHPNDTSAPIATLPNEVLTHAISHLSPNDLAAVALVSRRFNGLVTEPHAWRVAFARYFPGPETVVDASTRLASEKAGDIVRSAKRSFTRLTALASWRSEYILRTRLLRSLYRGKPNQISASITSARSGSTQTAAPDITYIIPTYTIINHLHATFGSGLNKRSPRFIHGADDCGMATCSDPTTGKVEPWGPTDPFFYSQFSERFPGVAEWGLGPGDVVGRPNVMDVSQSHGMIYGQGCPEGSCYYRALDEMRGRFVAEPTDFSMPEAGIPKLGVDGGAICCVWVAKSSTIPSLSEGLIGLLMGSAAGVVSACSLGTDGLRGNRLQRGELTARWVLSPGVPIVALAVDENYSLKRQAQNRIWAVALNALGELFYLTKFPTGSSAPQGTIDNYTEYLAWLTGRSVYWNLVESSRRKARPDPYNDAEIDGSYSPRSSWDGMCLSKEQTVAESQEIRQFLRKQPKDFHKSCIGWDMQRRLEVDFAGDDGNYAGEAMLVFDCGLEDGGGANIKRYTRWKSLDKGKAAPSSGTSVPYHSSLFGGSGDPDFIQGKSFQRTRSLSYMSTSSSPERANLVEEWRCSILKFGGLKTVKITATALDSSTFATLTMSEDPALGFSTASTASSPYASPMSVASQPASPSDIPGQRGRFMAAGTKTGVILVWDIRSPVSRSSDFSNDLDPIRIIYTESPEISCLALTALCLIHGGNDGLVQAWDPLASTAQPIKTLNSRFASRARRRLVQAQASVQGVGINMFAAGAICLDPDPTVLRGAVSLGNQIRYWSYSSSAADQYKSSKRKLRRSERGSNNAGERFSGTGRATLKDYIANEKYELEREKLERRRQAERMAGRFGIDLLGSEEEALAYAAMLSQETLAMEEKRRQESESSSALSSETVTPEPSVRDHRSSPGIKDDHELDAEIAEAIRLSLEDSPASATYGSGSPVPNSGFEVPIKFAKGRKSPPSRTKSSRKSKGKASAESSKQNELSDLEFALQLSLAEEQSRKDAEVDEFPPLSPTPGAGGGKGKGKML